MPLVLPDGSSGAITFLDLQNEVLAHGFNASRYRERVKRWLNEGLHRVARYVAVSPQTEALTTVAGESSIELPTGFLRVEALTQDEDNGALAQLTPVEFAHTLPSSGRPSEYTVSGGYLYLAPSPDRAYSLTLRYWGNPSDFVNDDDTFIDVGMPAAMNDYSMLLVSWALSRAYRAEDDAEMSRFHKMEFAEDLNLLKGDVQLSTRGSKRTIGGHAASAAPHFRFPGR
jgi:hypothetical protein